MKFTLEIELGNEAMQAFADIEHALRVAMGSLGDASEPLEIGESGRLWDGNGNTVGKWEVSR